MKRHQWFALACSSLLLGAVLGCASDRGNDPTAPEFHNAGTPPKVAKCSLNTPGFAGRTIGTHGGTITVGKNELVVPAGALTSSVYITMQVMGDSSRAVQFGPEGLVFAASNPATLTLDYKGCTLPAAPQVAYTTNQGVVLYLLQSANKPAKNAVSARLGHFSKYAVAY